MCGEHSVLVVDDDPSCRDLHRVWLEDRYDVVTAANGTAALDRVTGVDVVLLDRDMPDMDGPTVARRIADGEADPFVVIVSGIEPDVDIVDMPIDDYLTKPVSREDVLSVVETMLARAECQDLLREFYSLAARKAALEVEKSPTALAESEEYGQLTSDLESTRAAVEDLLADLDGEWQRAIEWVVEAEPPDGPASV